MVTQPNVKHLPLGDELFLNWLESPSTRPFVYHRGNLVVDRKESDDIEAVAWLAHEAYERGLIELSQRRLKANYYEYIATKRRDGNNRRARQWRTKQALRGRN